MGATEDRLRGRIYDRHADKFVERAGKVDKIVEHLDELKQSVRGAIESKVADEGWGTVKLQALDDAMTLLQGLSSDCIEHERMHRRFARMARGDAREHA